MKNVTFLHCNLNQSDFDYAQLSKTQFNHCTINANFTNGIISEITADSSNARGMLFADASIFSGEFRNSDCRHQNY